MTSGNTEAFASLFRGRTDSHGRVEMCVYEAVTLDHYQKHLEGVANLGIYFVLDDSTCHFAAVDLDEKDFSKALAIRDKLTGISIPAYITESKSKGYHVYILALERFKAVEIRRVLQHCLAGLGIKAEIFPKQDYHQPDDADGQKHPGSYINLPCFGQGRSFLTRDQVKITLETALPRIKRVSRDAVDYALEGIPGESPQLLEPPAATRQTRQTRQKGSKLPCFEQMMKGVPAGCRDEVAFRLAVHLCRQGMPIQLAQAALWEWDSKFNKPAMGENAIRAKLKQGYSGKYGLGCLNDLIQAFCDKDCPVYRKRHTEIDQRRMVGGKELDIMGLARMGTHPASFDLTIDGSTLTLGAEDLLSLRKVKALAIETLSYVPFPGMKTSEWEVLINSLLADVKQEEAPADASASAIFLEHMYAWLETAPGAETPADIEAGRPLKREDWYYFKMRDAVNYLSKHTRGNISPAELYQVVKRAKGGAQSVRLGKVYRLWFLPIRKDEEETPIDMEV